MRSLLCGMAISMAALVGDSSWAQSCSMTISNPRCEFRHSPLGIGTVTPRLSWELVARDAKAKGLKQSAYQIIAASSPELLKNEDKADLWNTGPRRSSATNNIEYAGKPLHSRSDVWWTVRVWDQDGVASELSTPQHWSIGLLEQSDWTGDWIGLDAAPAGPMNAAMRAELKALPWIRTSGETARSGQRATFRKEFELPGETISQAWIAGTVDQFGSVKVNGVQVAELTRWNPVSETDIRAAVRGGRNTVEIDVLNEDGFTPAASGMIFVQTASGTNYRIPLDKSWMFVKGNAAAAPVLEERGRPWGSNRNTEHFMGPAAYLRRDFVSQPNIKKATLYATALGTYWCEINGKRVGEDELTPGWTEYTKRIYHQTYDVTKLVRPGQNAIGVVLGDGWYAGLLGYTGRRQWYGGPARFKGQLEIEYADGTKQSFKSDGTWSAKTGPIVWNDLYMGSGYDSRLEMPGWSKPGYNINDWIKPAIGRGTHAAREIDVTTVVQSLVRDNAISTKVNNTVFGDPAYGVVKTLNVQYTVDGKAKSAAVVEGQTLTLPRAGESGAIAIQAATFGEPRRAEGIIEPQPGEPVRRFEELKTIAVTEPRKGSYVFDLGQNLVGFVRLNVKGKSGQRLVVRHAEMLNPDGTMYTSNLRGATATDYFWLNGKQQTLEPAFTFHGFRYVEIIGLTEEPSASMVTGIVVHTDMDRTGSFECSNELVNKLYHNIIWGQKGNYLEIPTDCPQRDERLGWTGDAQFFINTAAYNFDVSSFMSRWLKTLAHDAQFEDGSFAHVAPKVQERGGSTAWGDAAIVCTHAMYERYGDLRLVRENYEPMKAYMAWAESKTKDGITKIGGFGDWLNLKDPTSSDLIDTAYRINLLSQMIDMANWTGNSVDAAKFETDRNAARIAFNATFKEPDGTLKQSGQTGYALAFTMGLVSNSETAKAAEGFVQTIERKNWHLATGFIGTPRLLMALHNAGRDDVAYRLLLNTDYPSWLYQVKLGATTMWERWDGWTPETGFSDVGMNSFNHYAFGSVGDYLFSIVGGISERHTPSGTHLTIAPIPGPGLEFAKVSYRSNRGEIKSSWVRLPGGIEYQFTIPPNQSAEIKLPNHSAAAPMALNSGTHTIFVPDKK